MNKTTKMRNSSQYYWMKLKISGSFGKSYIHMNIDFVEMRRGDGIIVNLLNLYINLE